MNTPNPAQLHLAASALYARVGEVRDTATSTVLTGHERASLERAAIELSTVADWLTWNALAQRRAEAAP